MNEPLPQILDEIEDIIRLVNEAAKVASETISRVEKTVKEAPLELARLLGPTIIAATANVERKLTGKAEPSPTR
ncbi:hypothetical protein ACFLWZ_08745 [Chloroflexota bacterium]